ncbi:hypothetical protein HZA99_05030, partial [Candidatus Woesearchaeota archaeon]|nr:hypothetical protein [Candidatus Woesearchaeota archaeon]
MTKKSILLFLLVLSILLFTSACGSKFTTLIEDLSVASPTTFVPTSDPSQVGNSYVKVSGQINETNVSVETSPRQQEMSSGNEISEESGLEKKVYREGDIIAFDPIGVDPDGDIITYTYSRPLNSSGQWQTEIGDAGTYQITITASDGKTEVQKKVILLILSSNRAPSIDNLEDLTVAEGDIIALHPKVFDYNGDTVEIQYSKPFNNEGQWQTTYDDAGTYLAKVTVSDSVTSVEKQITIIVTNTDRAPVLDDIASITAVTGDTVQITPHAVDQDHDEIAYAFSDPFDAAGKWQTAEADVGTYTATVTATDGALFDKKTVAVVINHKNQAPVISVSTVRGQETEKIILAPTIVDPEGDSYTVTYNAPFAADGTWQTGYTDAGNYDVTITATDSNGAVSTATVRVEVLDK